jgi:tRNA1(Val) A37 N6-methylase TrmN6
VQKINYLLGFPHLKIYQNEEWFKFSIDSVLLPNFLKIKKDTKTILDIGTGNAVIPILLSTKTKVPILGVEIQKDVYELGKLSIYENKLEEQISIICEDIKEYTKRQESDCFDLITCNPPYFKMNENSNINEDIHKQYARHEISLNLDTLMLCSRKLLKNGGSLSIVHRPERLMEILMCAKKNNLEPKRIQFVYPKKGKEANIILLEFVKNGRDGLKIEEPLYIYNEQGEYTEEIQKNFS